MDCYKDSDTTVAEYHSKDLITNLLVKSSCNKVNNIKSDFKNIDMGVTRI